MNRKTQQLVVTVTAVISIILIGIAALLYWRGHNFKKYKNAEQHFSIKYPSDWTMAENTNGAAVIFFSPLENDLDYFKESLNVVVQDLSKNPMSLNDYTQTAIYQMKVVFKDKMEIIDSEPTTLAGHAAHRFIFKGAKTEVPLQYMCVWLVDGYKAYQVTYTAFASKYDLYLSKIQPMINSFRIRQ